MKSGTELIAEERQRQIEELGYTAEHYMQNPKLYSRGGLAEAGAYYAFTQAQRNFTDLLLARTNGGEGSSVWPWDPKYFNPTPGDRIKELAKAGALIAAEIDRIKSLA